MSIHLHHTRQIAAWVLGALALSPFALCFASSEIGSTVELSPVTGRMTMGGHPANDVFLCLDAEHGGDHSAFGWVDGDGKFRLSNMRWVDGGAEPGRYRAHLFTHDNGPAIPAKYRDPKTSGIVINVASDWNDFRIDLP